MAAASRALRPALIPRLEARRFGGWGFGVIGAGRSAAGPFKG